MNPKKLLFTSITVLFFFSQCMNGQNQGAGISDLNAKEFKEKIDAGTGILLDVRTPEEYAEGHIENARNINFLSEDFGMQINQLEKEKTYMIYCRSGGRSGRAAAKMKDAGFKKIYNLHGGILEWQANGLPVEK